MLARVCVVLLARGVASAPAQAAKPSPPQPPREIQFSGYTWLVKDSGGAKWGPGPNVFSPSTDNVWVDPAGRLHLKIVKSGSQWRSAEVISKASFGYGTYRWTLASDVSSLDPQVTLGMFTWHDTSADYAHREIDIEVARLGNASNPTNAQFVVQPYDLGGHTFRYTVPPAVASTHEFTWRESSIGFLSGTTSWLFGDAAAVPRAGGENARMNLWLFRGRAPLNRTAAEVVFERFEHVP
jgi:hypothetical protein